MTEEVRKLRFSSFSHITTLSSSSLSSWYFCTSKVRVQYSSGTRICGTTIQSSLLPAGSYMEWDAAQRSVDSSYSRTMRFHGVLSSSYLIPCISSLGVLWSPSYSMKFAYDCVGLEKSSLKMVASSVLMDLS